MLLTENGPPPLMPAIRKSMHTRRSMYPGISGQCKDLPQRDNTMFDAQDEKNHNDSTKNYNVCPYP